MMPFSFSGLKSRSVKNEPGWNQEVEHYFQRFGFCGRQIQTTPRSDLGIVVVIPCFDEPDLIGSLESLWICDRPQASTEVIVVINSSTDSPSRIRAQNQKTLEAADRWRHQHADPRMVFHFLDVPDQPARHAGVGLARKIGMDEALRRLADVARPDGVIVCFDADCDCEANHLTAVERHFGQCPENRACSIYFEHPLTGTLDPRVYDAVVSYELHLRYYVRALRHIGFPFAHHTIGSCMAVRAEVYLKQGGMNRRKAGEDFYFLNKIIPLGGFADLTETTVYPSPRESDRVPFGTGKAVRGFLRDGNLTTDPLQAFLDLKVLFERLPLIYSDMGEAGFSGPNQFPEALNCFLNEQGFTAALRELRSNTASEPAFRLRFFRWFDAFRAMKYLHYARDHYYGPAETQSEAAKLLDLLGSQDRKIGIMDARELLWIYRKFDRGMQ